ncbi:MAG: cation:proton antiporter [Ilumatobacteraceae bacterium]
MTDYLPAIIAVAVTAFAVVSKRLGQSAVTGTMVFTALGLVVGPEAFDLVDFGGLLGQPEFVRLVLTGTLVVVLFADASAINASRWSDDVVAARLLGIGLPLAIAFGWLAALVLLGDLEVWEAAVLAAMLAPTDAALGKAVVSNPRVPARIRQALNIESGLNDGIVLPFFIVFLETARAAEASLDVVDLVTELVADLGIAVAIGIAVGALGARAVRWGRTSGFASPYWLQIALLSLAVAAYAIATPLGGSGFIAAWVAGLVFGRTNRAAHDTEGSLLEFSEIVGDLLTMVSFFVFGVYLGPVLAEVTWPILAYAVVSLAVVRLVAVVIAVTGEHMRRSTLLYMGWFGPRGLATIILTIEIVDTSDLVHGATIANAALLTVGLSVLAHGLTAWWGSNAYADSIEAHPDGDDVRETNPTNLDVRVPLRSRHPHPPKG